MNSIRRNPLRPAHLRRKLIVGTVALVFLMPFEAHAQIEARKIDPTLLDESPDDLLAELKALRESIVRYSYSGESPRRQWAERIDDPLDGASVPINRAVAEHLFCLLESPKEQVSLAIRAEINHEVVLALRYAVPENPRLVEAAYNILSSDLPNELRYFPDINLFAGCLNTLIRSGGKRANDFLREAESEAFWRDRIIGVEVEAGFAYPTDSLLGHPQRALLLLRSLVGRQKAFNQPAFAISFIKGILSRESEDPAYKAHMQLWLDMAEKSLTATPSSEKPPMELSNRSFMPERGSFDVRRNPSLSSSTALHQFAIASGPTP